MSRPFAPHAFSMTWRDGLFVHWPVDPDRLRPHVPPPLQLDTYDGRAWVSLLPFVLSNAGVRYTPTWTRLTFPERNLRTYVRFDGTPGLSFLSVDLGLPWLAAIVGGTTPLPCYAAAMDVSVSGGSVTFRSVRRRPERSPARFDVSYRPDGDRFRAEPGTLDHWLAERRRLFQPAGDRVLYADVAHDPWDLQPAVVDVHADTMLASAGLPRPVADPRVRYSARCSMTGSVPRWLDSLEADDRVRPPSLARR